MCVVEEREIMDTNEALSVQIECNIEQKDQSNGSRCNGYPIPKQTN
jgi:hypothetical protein